MCKLYYRIIEGRRMNKYISFIIVIISLVFGSGAKASKSTFLFCLKHEVLPLKIDKIKHGVK